jgi:hypothetical protein
MNVDGHPLSQKLNMHKLFFDFLGTRQMGETHMEVTHTILDPNVSVPKTQS